MMRRDLESCSRSQEEILVFEGREGSSFWTRGRGQGEDGERRRMSYCVKRGELPKDEKERRECWMNEDGHFQLEENGTRSPFLIPLVISYHGDSVMVILHHDSRQFTTAPA